MIRLLAYLTGGRPMKYLGSAFTDTVSGYQVNYYEDLFGRRFLACSSWGWFRILCEDIPNG